MANKKISALPPEATPTNDDALAIVNDPLGQAGSPQTRQVTVSNLMSLAPVQSVAGDTGAVTLDTNDISGLGTAAITAATDYATSAQGLLADSATQPGDLGTAATTAATDYATSAQGTKADAATQPLDNISSLTNDSSFITSAGAPVQSVAGQTGTVTLSNTDISGLGTAAALNTGVADGDVIKADATGLPAIDGSQLTGVTASITAIGPFGYAHINTAAAGAGTGISWGVHDSMNYRTAVTFHAAQLDTNYNVAAHYDDYYGYGVLIQNKTINGFDVDFYDSGGMGTSPASRPAVLMVYASDPTLRTIVAAPAGGGGGGGGAFTGVEWSNMASNNLYFDDYQQNVYNMMGNASWGSTHYMYFDISTLAGKWKKYTIADYYDSANYTWTGAMWTDLNAALGTSGIGMSAWGGGTLGALYGNQIENSTNTPIYVWASTAGTTVTAVQASDGYSATQNFVPIIFGMDWDNMQGWENTLGYSPGPKWGMTLVMDVNGYLEETKDASGYPYHNPIQPYAAYLYSTTTSNTFNNFSLTGNIGGGASGTVTAGDQT
jgi:hypothetical protein